MLFGPFSSPGFSYLVVLGKYVRGEDKDRKKNAHFCCQLTTYDSKIYTIFSNIYATGKTHRKNGRSITMCHENRNKIGLETRSLIVLPCYSTSACVRAKHWWWHHSFKNQYLKRILAIFSLFDLKGYLCVVRIFQYKLTCQRTYARAYHESTCHLINFSHTLATLAAISLKITGR